MQIDIFITVFYQAKHWLNKEHERLILSENYTHELYRTAIIAPVALGICAIIGVTFYYAKIRPKMKCKMIIQIKTSLHTSLIRKCQKLSKNKQKWIKPIPKMAQNNPKNIKMGVPARTARNRLTPRSIFACF